MSFKRGKMLNDRYGYSRPDLLIGNNYVMSKRSQVTIFIILAVLIIAGIAVYFNLKAKTGLSAIPSDFKPIEESFLSCAEDYAKAGISILEENGGYIYLPKFEPGNEYAPSSNMLDLSGTPIPFWYYISSNNIAREQVPSKNDMEKQLEKYLDENVECDFSGFESKGYEITLDKIKSNVKISDYNLQLEINSDLDLILEDKSYKISSHNKEINTKLGKFYKEALDVYNFEKQNVFLEKYGLDVLYNYAPMTDVQLSCSPKIWSLDNVKNEIKQGLEANVMMIKMKGDYYSKADKYFVIDSSTDEAVQFLYNPDWATKIEVANQNGFLIAEPVGNQPGLGALGFCYVPVHFVYNMMFPVLVQFYDNNEIFKFPVVAVIQGNKEKKPEEGTYFGEQASELCRYKSAQVDVYTYDTDLNPVEAEISFECFTESCSIGKTSLENGEAHLEGYMPQCVNGFIVAKGENYKEKRVMISTNEENSANIILDKLYDVEIDLKIDNQETSDSALAYFESGDYSTSLVWPEQKSAKLADGLYNISVYVYRQGSIKLPETKQKKCVEIPRPGVLGIFGLTKENCFDMVIPEQLISNIISGGGKSQIYITESDLIKGKADLSAESVKVPGSIQELQNSYISLEDKQISLEFK